MLPNDLRALARIAPIDQNFADISSMRDSDQMGGQSGGRRGSRKSRKSSKSRKSRKNRKSRKSRKSSKSSNSRKSRKSSKSRKNRRQSGGRHMLHEGSPLNSPNMLLSKSDAATAGTADFNSNRLN
jgi:hypothetical protein